MLKLDYVASGISHARLSTTSFQTNLDVLNKTNELLKSIQDTNGHKYSVLFNAFREKRIGEIINNTIRDSCYSVHADSGGLQVVTLGKVVTPQLKDEIYETQARLSDVAMSFDEIPVVLTSARSSFHDIKSRYFDPALVVPYAKMSGQNLKRQLEKFAELGTKTRPLMILQGNDLACYQQWMDIILSEIPAELQPMIGGISLGAGALGQGLLEDAERHMIYSQLKGPDHIMQNLHILGVGSVKRMIPLLIFDQAGLIDRNLHVSYDSTTHTSGISMGNYYMDGGLLPLSKNTDKALLRMYEDLHKFKHWFGVDEFKFEDVRDCMCAPAEWKAKHTLDTRVYERFSVLLTYLFGSILNFTEDINKCYESKDYLKTWLDKETKPFDLLYNVRDIEDFNDWKRQFGRLVPSKAVSKKTSDVSLEDFV